MSDTLEPITLRLKTREYDRLARINVKGGQETLKRKLLARMKQTADGWEIQFSFSEMGELIHHMGAYGEGGWQNVLRNSFWRALAKYAGVQQ